MIIDFNFHPDAEKALNDLRLTLLDNSTPPVPKYPTVPAMIQDHTWLSLTKVALERHPPADLDAAIKAKQTEANAFFEAEFQKKKTAPK